MAYRGRFYPKHPLKYKGDPNKIIYRSSWEVRVMKYLDDNDGVVWWASEEMNVKYISPVDGRVHRYFPDFVVKVRRKDNSSTIFMLEVKPEAQTKLRQPKKVTKQYVNEAATYAVNQAKWKYAEEFCKDHGWVFRVVTEKDLGI
jgi:hypothetical protein